MLIKFLEKCNDKTYESPFGKFILNKNKTITLSDGNESVTSDDWWDLADFKEFRVCNFCGRPFDFGMTDDDGDFYSCEECFDEMLENGEYAAVDDDGCGGYYLDKEGNATGIYYTEWY